MQTARLIIQDNGHALGWEELLAKAHALTLGLPVLQASVKQMERGRVVLGPTDLVVGGVPFVLSAMRQLGIAVPEHTPYPSSLAPYLHRKVHRVPELRMVLQVLQDGGPRVFVKPAKGWKRFTGFVAEFPDDYRFAGASRRAPVWVSETVRFVSEWRCYVEQGTIRACQFADHGGDRAFRPDLGVIQRACRALADAGQAPAGFVIDFGVLDTGQTALIELNDGFSFGAYDGLDAEVLFDVVNARWRELVCLAHRNLTVSPASPVACEGPLKHC